MNVYKVTNISNLSKKANDLTFLDENNVSQLLKAGESKLYSFNTIPKTLRRVERLGFLVIEFISTATSYQSQANNIDISVKPTSEVKMATQETEVNVTDAEQTDENDEDKKISKSKKKL